jgi:hypothetical protein
LWEAVRDVRDRWGITAKNQLPPPVVGRLLPEGAPDFRDGGYEGYVVRWQLELFEIRMKVDPRRHLTPKDLFGDEALSSWNELLSACVLYDPPADGLIEFASYGTQQPGFLSDDRVSPDALAELPEMVDPPVRSLWELSRVGDWFWLRIVAHLDERYLKPLGMDLEDLLPAVMLDVPGLREEFLTKREQYSQRYYIEVDEHTNREDVLNALKMIDALGRPKKTKPRRDRLVAVQCALLYDRHNERNPEDRRQWRWTYESLANELGLDGPRAAKDHIVLGRQILHGEEPEGDR